MICDPIAGLNGLHGVTLPLFKRGTERERFERALYWLAKTIEQLLKARGLKFEPREELLFNINKLFQCDACFKLAL
jgi:hypothetical protein